MSEPLARFFAAAPRLLFGEDSPAQFTAELGASPSGAQRLRFYQILIERNLAKILRDVYGGLRVWLGRDRPDLWRALITDYARAHPPAGWDPNGFAAAFPDFIAARRAADPRLGEVDEELVDFYWIEYLAFAASDTTPPGHGPDGVDHCLFVRQYSRPIPGFARALRRGEAAPLPDPAPTLTIVFRNRETLRVEAMFASLAMVAALVRRQGKDPRAVVPDLPEPALAAAEAELRRRHALGPD